MPYAIVVDVPDAREDCFVALPFGPAFDPVLRAIKAAASDHGLRTVVVRSGVSQPGVFFTTDIVDAIRSARVVVAVCSEEATKKANPNVLYELGWAHALGKPTVILTSGGVPDNLTGRHYHRYAVADVESGKLAEDTSRQLEMVLKRMRNPLTDPNYESIHVAHERHLMFHDPAFWDHFRTILSCIQLIHKEHYNMRIGWVETLSTKALELWSYPGQGPLVSAFLDAWKKYCEFFESFTYPRVYRDLEQQVRSVDSALTFIKANASQELKRHVDACDEFYTELRQSLVDYPQLFKETKRCVENLPQDPMNIGPVYAKVSAVSEQTRSIVIDSSELMGKLIEMIRTEGE